MGTRRLVGGIMKCLATLLAATSMIASAAHASDKPVIGPAPAWVGPSPPIPRPDTASEAPVEWLLSDQQVKLESGRQIFYSNVAMRIGTPQGLAAGNISFPWRPDTDEIGVHKLLIHRGDQVIDVLASGQTFTVMRREQNLENATLDGVLTANIQPEGLQVGDVLEFAISVASSDPTLKGHVEQISAAWNGIPIGRARLRMQWPASLPARLRASPAMPGVKPVRKGDVVTVDYALDGIEPIIPPKGAPARYGLGRYVEVTDFSSWADLAALLSPLYAKASVLPATGGLKAEVDRIAALSADPKVRAEAALALVQDRVRYVALAMGVGGLTPADAETTWARRYGDCKAKTALLLGLLRELGIAADAVAVNAMSGDGLDQRLPIAGLFNHVLVRATIGGKTYWLDGTRTGDTSLDRVQTPHYSWGLPLVAKDAALVPIVPPPMTTPNESVSITIDATAGLAVPAPFKVETVLRGDAALSTRNSMAALTGAARDQALRRYWKGQHDSVEPSKMGASFDAASGEYRLTMEGLAKMDWDDGWYETDGMRLGYKADFKREDGQDKAAPYAVGYSYYSVASEKILLPPGFTGKAGADNADVEETVAGIEYKRRATLTGNVFLIEKSERSVAPEFSADQATAAEAALRRLADRTVYLRKPPGYRQSGKELAALDAEKPATAADYVRRAQRRPADDHAGRAADLAEAVRLDPNEVKLWIAKADAERMGGAAADSLKTYDAGLAKFPGNVRLLAGRGLANERLGNADAARSDFDTARSGTDDAELLNAMCWEKAIAGRALDSALLDCDAALTRAAGDTALLDSRGLVLLRLGRPDEAIAAYDKVLASEGKYPTSLYGRALAWAKKGDKAKAQADKSAALNLDPNVEKEFSGYGLPWPAT